MTSPEGKHKSITRESSVIECWQRLNSTSVGASELESIAAMLTEKFAEGTPGPAAIARILADHGVPLRHPEILEFDTAWRERQMIVPVPRELQTIDDAIYAIENLQKVANSVEGNESRRLWALVVQVRQELESFAGAPVLSEKQRTLAAELAHWLTIWLENPAIFDEWLSIRRESPEFRDKFL